MKGEWTKQKPKARGWYWWRWGSDEPCIAEVFCLSPYQWWALSLDWRLSNMKGHLSLWWSEPIQLPSPPPWEDEQDARAAADALADVERHGTVGWDEVKEGTG